MQENYDVIIIGAGIVGSLTARFLSRYALDVLLIDQKSDIGTGATAANSALIHGGYDAMPGSLKAEMNVRGNELWGPVAEELEIPFERGGTYVVAVGEDELPALEDLKARGDANEVPTEIISGEEMRKREPLIHSDVSGALFCPTGGICDPWAATVAAAENAVMNGVALKLETEFEDFLWEDESRERIVGIRTNRGEFGCRWVVNAAGLYADRVMHKAGVRPDFVITPRRGEYYVMDRADIAVQNVLFPVPGQVSKGILVTTTLHGNTLVGPNADEIEDKTNDAVTAEGMQEVWEGGQKLVPGLNPRHIIAVFAGLRPGGNATCEGCAEEYHKDFIVELPVEVEGLVNLGGIESPGLSAAPAIAERVVELLGEAGAALEEKPDWDPVRPARPVFRHLSKEEQAALVEQDPRYGRIICRCEYVTEGEIVAEIHAPIPATTYDAIKRRTWTGTGRCQGGFDMPRVVAILARELGQDPVEVSKKGDGSEFLSRPTKNVPEA
ncbi:MAG: NAD(P)/FAD-dependent oxidoreductase [Anaerolineales bacterium]